MKLKFGYFDTDVMLTTSNFIISNIVDMNSEEVIAQADVDGWITAQSIKNRIFGLPQNYQIEGRFVTEDHARFVVRCLSFFFGVKLGTLPMEFLDATNIKLNNAFGFVFMNNADIERALSVIYEQFTENSDINNMRISGIINLLFMGRNKFYLQFEQFEYCYMALEACYKFISEKYGVKKAKYESKIGKIADWTGIDVPVKFQELPRIRNNLFHEGLYVNNLLGYSHLQYNILFLNNFICKVLFKILDINVPGYITEAKCETRDMIGLTIAH